MTLRTDVKRLMEQAKEKIDAQCKPINLYEHLDFSVFSDSEEEKELRTFLSTLEHYAEGVTDLRFWIMKLTNEEFYEFSRWLDLERERGGKDPTVSH